MEVLDAVGDTRGIPRLVRLDLEHSVRAKTQMPAKEYREIDRHKVGVGSETTSNCVIAWSCKPWIDLSVLRETDDLQTVASYARNHDRLIRL